MPQSLFRVAQELQSEVTQNNSTLSQQVAGLLAAVTALQAKTVTLRQTVVQTTADLAAGTNVVLDAVWEPGPFADANVTVVATPLDPATAATVTAGTPTATDVQITVTAPSTASVPAGLQILVTGVRNN